MMPNALHRLLPPAIPQVAVAHGFGAHGDGCIALVETAQLLRQALRSIRAFLQTDNAAPAVSDEEIPA